MAYPKQINCHNGFVWSKLITMESTLEGNSVDVVRDMVTIVVTSYADLVFPIRSTLNKTKLECDDCLSG